MLYDYEICVEKDKNLITYYMINFQGYAKNILHDKEAVRKYIKESNLKIIKIRHINYNCSYACLPF